MLKGNEYEFNPLSKQLQLVLSEIDKVQVLGEVIYNYFQDYFIIGFKHKL